MRAQSQASPPNQNSNTNRAQVDLLCPPADIGNTLFAIRDVATQPVTTTFTDIAAAGPLYYYQVRTANACEVESSE